MFAVLSANFERRPVADIPILCYRPWRWRGGPRLNARRQEIRGMASSRLALGVAGGLVIGFLPLFAMVGMTVWLGERSNVLFQQTALQRDTRIAAVELRDALRTAESS